MAALKFGESNGSAVKNTAEAYKYVDGENVVRLVGGVLARYMYWVKGTNNKDVPLECLSFDREQEKFTNAEVDHVPIFFPEKKLKGKGCAWAYAMNCIDVKTGKVVVLNLKKKLFEQIKTASEDLGDPTDPETGWDCVFKKAKNGPEVFNVEYTLNVLRCKKRPLTDVERTAVDEAKTIDEKIPRQTSAEIKAFLEKITQGAQDESDEGMDDAAKEAIADL